MLLAEPQRTPYDMHFQIFGIPVRVHPLFWLVSLILGFRGSEGSENAGVLTLVWIIAVFISILIHELGHSFTMRYFGQSSHVVLYMMGGLAVPDSASYSLGNRNSADTPRNHILISAAGPGAGFLLAAIVSGVVYLSGGAVVFDFLNVLPSWQVVGVSNEILFSFVHSMLWINIYWGLINLLPVYPLDGGQIARELFMLNSSRDGIVRSLWLSVITGAGLAALGLFGGRMFIAIMFGMLAFSSYQVLQQYSGRGGGFGGGSPW